MKHFATAWILMLSTPSMWADWRDEAGFTRLQTITGVDLPTSASAGLMLTEAYEDGDYTPDTSLSIFDNQTFTLASGSSGESTHATHTARNFFGENSQLPGESDVTLIYAGDWLDTGFLNRNDTDLPESFPYQIQSHSWINVEMSDPEVTEVNQRLDYAIDRDGMLCVVGMNNGSSTTLPQALGQSYHTISVGRDDGKHSAGFTTADGTGRIKPEIVGPSAPPESATSWTTPMVAGTAALVAESLRSSPYSLTGSDVPRVTKAILLASATKSTVPGWSNANGRPLDLRYGAGELNAWHAWSTLKAGRYAASETVVHPARGWAAEAVSGSSQRTYFLTIPNGAPSTPFSAMITWHREITTELTGIAIFKERVWDAQLANLNLRLHQANDTQLGSLIAESSSTVDNLELVYEANLPPGDYALVVENLSSETTNYALAWHSLPAVTIAVSPESVNESDALPATVTLTRTGESSMPLLVPLGYSGTAVSGTDFLPPPDELTIPAGAETATFQITPISDDIALGERSLTLSIDDDFALVAGPATSVTIEDKPFDDWRFSYFNESELGDSAVSGPSADPDRDQLANLIEYALGLDPRNSSPSPLTAVLDSGHLTITVSKSSDATDITWAAEVSNDLDIWSPAEILVNTLETFSARDSQPVTDSSIGSIRLRITRP